MNKTGKRLLKYALSGWAIAFLGAWLLLGGEDSLFGEEGEIQFLLFLSLAPGAIAGLIVGHLVNKNNEPPEIEQIKTPEERLVDLKNLLERGVLTPEEFDDQKKENIKFSIYFK